MHISITKSGVHPKAAIERVQAKARFQHVEREQARASLISSDGISLSIGAPRPCDPRCIFKGIDQVNNTDCCAYSAQSAPITL